MREIKFKYILQHPENKNIVISKTYTLQEIEDMCIDDVIIDLDEKYGIKCNCLSENQNHCECSPAFEDYKIIDRLQYTGLKDIYEDDFTEDGLVFYSEEYLGFFVKLFDRNLDEEIKPLYDCLSEKVIGNKHENSELMERLND